MNSPKMGGEHRRSLWTWLIESLEAQTWRDRFDAVAPKRPALLVTVLVLAMFGVIAWLLSGAPPYCKPLPVAVIRLEVTFDATRFASLLQAEGGCRDYALSQLGIRDIVFSIVYPFALVAVYLWTERWRRFNRSGSKIEPPELEPPEFESWQRYAIVGPFIAGLFDIIEDVSLRAAAAGFAPNLLVWLGSAFSAVKWLLLLTWAVATLAELYRGPRGIVLRLVRFSVLAVALGALPLLAVPQGQDILQRIAEAGLHPYGRLSGGVIALFLAATAVWYCARRLVQLDLDRQATPEGDSWYDFFGEQIPRILGVAMLALAGLALARAGLFEKRFLGVAVASVVAVLLAQHWMSVPAAPPSPTRLQALASEGAFVQAVGLVISLILLIWAFVASNPGNAEGFGGAVIALRVAAATCLVLTWLLHLIVRYRRVILAVKPAAGASDYATRRQDLRREAVRKQTVRTDERGAADRVRRILPWVAVAVSAAFLLAFTFRAVDVGRFLGSLTVLTIFAVNAVFFGSLTVYAHKRWRVALVRFGLVFAILCSLWNENHNVPVIAADASPWYSKRPTLVARLGSWLAALPPGGGGAPSPVVLVAAAGGGLRAAYWTAMALAVAQDSNPEFARHVVAMSGVSGGSLGIAEFASLVRDGGPAIDSLPCARDTDARAELPRVRGPYVTCIRRLLRDDYLSPVLAKMLAPDFAQRFWPAPVPYTDRSTGLEQSWERSYNDATTHDTFHQGLSGFSASAPGAVVPLLLLNSTHVETGKRYIASEVRTDSLEDTRDVLSLLRADVPLSAAVHNSARFTYVSPGGHLDRGDGEELGRVVDGGYFENSGLVTLRELYNLVRADDSASGRPRRRVVALYLCNDPVSCDVSSAVDSSIADSLARTRSTLASELVAPIQAVINARDARGALASAQMRRALGADFIQLNVCDRLAQKDTLESAAAIARERVVSPPLGWSLSHLARKWMDESLILRADKQNMARCPEANRRGLDALYAALRQ